MGETKQGFLVLADISGFTAFVTVTEVDGTVVPPDSEQIPHARVDSILQATRNAGPGCRRLPRRPQTRRSPPQPRLQIAVGCTWSH